MNKFFTYNWHMPKLILVTFVFFQFQCLRCTQINYSTKDLSNQILDQLQQIDSNKNEEKQKFKQTNLDSFFIKAMSETAGSSGQKIQNNHYINRILQTPNQKPGEPAENYSNDILEQQDDSCEPMNCKHNCCDKNGVCPENKSDCFFYKCENFMCQNGGCCIKGVCRPEKDCNNSKIFRYISIGILVFCLLILLLFKQRIEKFFQSREWYSISILNKELTDQNQKSISDNIAEKTTQNQIQTENRSNVLNTHKKNKSTLAAFNLNIDKNNLNHIYYPGQRSILQNSNEDNYSNTIFSDNKKENLVFKNTDIPVEQFAQSPIQSRIPQLKDALPSQFGSSFNINRMPMGISELQNQQIKHN